jgi:hypothetical protein
MAVSAAKSIGAPAPVWPSGRQISKPWAKFIAGHQLRWHIGKSLQASTA